MLTAILEIVQSQDNYADLVLLTDTVVYKYTKIMKTNNVEVYINVFIIFHINFGDDAYKMRTALNICDWDENVASGSLKDYV